MVEWLDDLCPRMHDFLQRSFNKEFSYDFYLASQATENSIEMLRQGKIGHFKSLSQAQAEVVAFSEIPDFNNDYALISMILSWQNSKPHREALEKNNTLGIGFAYDNPNNILYSTIRLR